MKYLCFRKVIAQSVFSGRQNDKEQEQEFLEPHNPCFISHTHIIARKFQMNNCEGNKKTSQHSLGPGPVPQ